MSQVHGDSQESWSLVEEEVNRSTKLIPERALHSPTPVQLHSDFLEDGTKPNSMPFTLHHGFWFTSELIKSILLVQSKFVPRHDDVILATHPKCGTTWLKALAFTTVNRFHKTFANHPLLNNHPQDLVPFLELPMRQIHPVADLDCLPSPRLLATHIPFSLLPKSVTDSGCRFVYMCRDPKDVFVSRWHFRNKCHRNLYLELDDAFRLFCDGVSACGPTWDHYVEYWNESKAKPDKVLFLKYEEMMSNPVKGVKRLAEFLAVPFTIEEERDGIVDEVVRLCSIENLSSLDVNSTGVADRIGGLPMENSAYFRVGKVGDWVNYLSDEMAQKLDCIAEEKLKRLGLPF